MRCSAIAPPARLRSAGRAGDKILAYLSSGKPILAAVAGDAADVVMQAGAGLACAPHDPKAMASAARQFFAMPEAERRLMAQRGLTAAHGEYDRETLVEKIEMVLEGLVDGSTGNSAHVCSLR